jgi:hypothetical protein
MSRIQKLETIYKEQLTSKHIKDISVFLQSILNADVTKGKYARFLIDCFLNDKFLEEDLIGGLDSIVGQAISLFHKHKNKLPLEHRSVYALNPETGKALYQSPGDLWNNVKQFQGEPSGKELKREEQEKVYRETEFIYKDEETGFQIISPLTEESAKWWGKGTRWCTSAENNNMFEEYAKDAPLFILLMPNNSGHDNNVHKLQLWNNDDEIQFMDEADNDVTLQYIEQNWKLLEPICLWLNDLQLIPDECFNEEIGKIFMKKNGLNLKFIPDEYRTKEICQLAVQQNGKALCYVPYNLKTPELCELAVQCNGLALYHVPEKYKIPELCNMAVQNNGEALQYVPEELRIKELCELAIQNEGKSLCHVPEGLRSKELYELAIQSDGMALSIIPINFKTRELCELAVKQNGLALHFVPEYLKTSEIYAFAVKQNGYTLGYVPEELRTKELCDIAIRQNVLALRYIPIELKTKELCNMAVKQNGLLLEHVPEELRTSDLCKIAVERNGMALICIPEEYKTKELCEIAVTNNKASLLYVPNEFYDTYKFEKHIYDYQKIFQEFKEHFPQKNLSLDIK